MPRAHPCLEPIRSYIGSMGVSPVPGPIHVEGPLLPRADLSQGPIGVGEHPCAGPSMLSAQPKAHPYPAPIHPSWEPIHAEGPSLPRAHPSGAYGGPSMPRVYYAQGPCLPRAHLSRRAKGPTHNLSPAMPRARVLPAQGLSI